MTDDAVTVFVGNISHCKAKFRIETFRNGFVAIRKKQIIAVGNSSTDLKLLESQHNVRHMKLKSSQMLIPGFIDTHIHAAQYPNCGLGYDKTLLDWLDLYTFKLEKKHKDLEFAKKVFDAVVNKTLSYGTTTACYYASLFAESSFLLAKSAYQLGQRALIGKVNMTQSSCSDYLESEEESLENTIKFIQSVASLQSDLVKPIITPRFALSTDIPHMEQLSCIAKNNNLHLQTHISENVDEVRIVNETYGMPYADVYDHAHLLTEKTVLAHGIYLSDDELRLIAARGASIAHCPASNTCLKSGLCDVRRLWEFNVKVGLGTDVAGGPTPSIISAMRSALDVSTHLSFIKDKYEPLSYVEAFYLATLGGAKALAMNHTIGNFEVGKEFDALVIDINPDDLDLSLELEPLEVLQKFINCGDDRNVVNVFVAGKDVKKLKF